MTIGEWTNRNLPMVWSIYDDDSYTAFTLADRVQTDQEASKKAYREIVLDMRAPADTPDGMFAIFHNGSQEGRSAGVLVRNGRFIPENIAAATFEAVCKSYDTTANDVRTGKDGIDHVFIEKFTWHPERRILQVHTGS